MNKILVKSIRIENFKSYNKLIELGPFHQKINSITGLNGSGKSNLIDAIFFVFGKRASNIRFKKLYELIYHSDSEHHVHSSVSLILYNRDGSFKQNKNYMNEIYISRQIFSNNISIHYVNGKEINFSEMNRIFLYIGINIINDYFLIKQNQIERISLLKPMLNSVSDFGLLEYTDDTFRTSRYNEFIIEKRYKIKLFLRSSFIKFFFKKKCNYFDKKSLNLGKKKI